MRKVMAAVNISVMADASPKRIALMEADLLRPISVTDAESDRDVYINLGARFVDGALEAIETIQLDNKNLWCFSEVITFRCIALTLTTVI